VTVAACGGNAGNASARGSTGGAANGSPRDAGNGASGSDATPTSPNCPVTGYPGDDSCLAPPAGGIQLHYGPASYSPDDVTPFLLEPGKEVTDCFHLVTENDSEIAFDRSHVRMRVAGVTPGAPNLLVFTTDGTAPPGLGTCGALSSNLVLGSYGATLDVPDRIAPENEGLAARLPARQPLVMRVHYENPTNQPMLREIWVNLDTLDAAAVKAGTGSLGLIGGISMQVAPHTTRPVTASAVAPQDMRLLGLTGYFHAHTKRLTAWKESSGTQTLLLEQYDVTENRPTYFDSFHDNPAPERALRRPGGFNGPLELASGDTIAWECEVDNDLDTTISFGNPVRTAEMCNLFGYFAPSDGTAWVTTGI
jgi:hypothetical protein